MNKDILGLDPESGAFINHKSNKKTAGLKTSHVIKNLTNAEIIEAITKCRGLLYLASNVLSVNYQTLAERVNNDPELQEAVKDQRGKTLDMAEAKLMQAVDKGEQWAITMLLRTLGRERGFVERQEVSNVTTVRLQIVEEIVDSNQKQIAVTVNPTIDYRPNLPEGFSDAKTEGSELEVESDY
jgi:hypothetical protein